ncbi:hypothetical protein PTW37_07500 [Arthrobacter agilis]|uniref:hypothetical protein n=1 Tax=Arthrobacter agilis TaxID=37921 RepID=UPI002366FAAC|nr:hypothetical protein [Arthrobacter agilis]WDF34724.1 hypothetical protein PTW37_07500 [Arthrobacter agilis]
MTGSSDHDALPLPDYDHIPLGTLPTRITGLDEAGLRTLIDYEEAHGDRLPVKLVLQQRLEAVRGGAQVSEAAGTSRPEVAQTSGGSPVSPATSGPPINPPSQGVPTNPAQPR